MTRNYFQEALQRLAADVDWDERDREQRASLEESRRAAAAAEQRAVADALLGQGAPVRALRCARGDELRASEALAAVRGSLRASEVLVALSGPPGVGKTVGAVWWLLRARPDREVATRPPRFVTAPALARWPRYQADEMRELLRARALVVDDLGVEYDDEKGAFRSLLDEVVDARYSAEFPTLITTNLPSKRFAARYGQRLIDRMREAGGFIALGGESLRKGTTE